MTTNPHPPEQREELARLLGVIRDVLVREGIDEPTEGIHSWRCAYPDRYGKCQCLDVTMEEIATALAANVTLPADHAPEVERLREALGEIKRFAEAHHGDEQPHIWLHGLTVDIPALVDSALDMRPPKPPRPPADREMA